MQRTINAQAARQRLGELLEGVYYRGDEVVIERAGKPMGVVISPQRYADIERRRAEARERFWQAIDEIREQNKDVDPDEVQRVVDETIAEVRRERRARRAAAERGGVEQGSPAVVDA